MKNIEGVVVQIPELLGLDEIIAPELIGEGDTSDLREHLFDEVDNPPTLSADQETVLVLLRGFRSGSVQEEAARVLNAAGVRAVLGPTFDQLTVRNFANNGLPLLEMPGVLTELESGRHVTIDFEGGVLRITERDTEFALPEIPDFLRNLFSQGGVVASMRHLMENNP